MGLSNAFKPHTPFRLAEGSPTQGKSKATRNKTARIGKPGPKSKSKSKSLNEAQQQASKISQSKLPLTKSKAVISSSPADEGDLSDNTDELSHPGVPSRHLNSINRSSSSTPSVVSNDSKEISRPVAHIIPFSPSPSIDISPIASPLANDTDADTESSTPPAAQKPDSESSFEPAALDNPPSILPPALLSRLVHRFLPSSASQQGYAATLSGPGRTKAETTLRVQPDALALTAKYMETFIREAIARAAWERSLAVKEMEKSGSVGPGDDFLDVEDLEKLAPQLLLDF